MEEFEKNNRAFQRAFDQEKTDPVTEPSPFKMAFRLASDQGKTTIPFQSQVSAQSRPQMAFRMASDESRYPISTAHVYDPVPLDYQPFYSALGREIEETQRMNPPLVDQSYGPGIKALGDLANHDAVQRYENEMHDQSGVNPKPGDPPSFSQTILNSALNEKDKEIEKGKHAVQLGEFAVDQMVGGDGAGVRKSMDEAKARQQGQAKQERIRLHQVFVEGDPAQSILNGNRFLAETLGEKGLEIAADRLTGGKYPLIKATWGAITDSGDNFVERYNKTGELDATNAIVHGVPSGVLGAIPVGAQGGRKTIVDRIKQGVAEAGKEQVQDLLKEGAIMDNTKGQYWTEDRQKEITSDYLTNLLFYTTFGGK